MIKSRLDVYLPFVELLLNNVDLASAVDLGCGRGEWLELLQEIGFDAQGVDVDEGMLSACRELGLNVQALDAVDFLKAQPQESLALITGFHIVEHLSFHAFQTIVQEAIRVLKPGGLLILETPNPENIVVGTSNFYFDPTHLRPMPIQLLTSLTEYFGFARVKALRLHEDKGLVGDKRPTLFDVLNGVSPDCAVVAQKGADSELMCLFDELFERDYGLTLELLARHYESYNEIRFSNYEARLVKAELAEATLEKVRNTWLWRALRWIHRRIDGFVKP